MGKIRVIVTWWDMGQYRPPCEGIRQGRSQVAADNAGAGGDRVSWRSWYALGLLFVVYVFNFIDRSILGMLNQPIKEDLGLSDTQMGFLGGVAFAIFYTFIGIPVARLADVSVRRNVVAVSLAVWSGMTVLC